MTLADKTIVCTDCEEEFIHSAADQTRYAERGLVNDPKRCPGCREKRRARSRSGPPRGGQGGGGHRGGGGGGYGGGGGGGGGGGYGGGGGGGGYGGGGGHRPPRESFDAVCAECGTATTLPFKPKGDRPVYCRDCFRARR